MVRQARSRSFYGSSVSSRRFEHFVITERNYPAGYSTPIHAHERALFCLVLDGGYEERHCRRMLQCTSTTMLFHAAHEDHLEKFGDCGARSLIVELAPEWLERIRQIASLNLQSTLAHEGGMLQPVCAKLYQEFLSGDPVSGVVIEGVLLELAGEFFRTETRRELKRPAWLARAVDVIRENFPSRLSLSGIAGEVGVHPVHLAQSFRKVWGCTVGDYVRRVRIEYACEQLVRTDIPLIQLAADAGFADQSHFGRTFKRAVGMPPSEYRAGARR